MSIGAALIRVCASKKGFCVLLRKRTMMVQTG